MQAATCGSDGMVRVWGAHDGMLATELGNNSPQRPAVNDVCFTLEGDAVLTALTDKSVKMWDINGGRIKHTLTGACYAAAAVGALIAQRLARRRWVAAGGQVCGSDGAVSVNRPPCLSLTSLCRRSHSASDRRRAAPVLTQGGRFVQ